MIAGLRSALALAFALFVLACGGPTWRSSRSDDPYEGSLSQAAVEQANCERWGVGGERGVLSGPSVCTQVAAERRAFEARQAERAYHAAERARESAERAAGVQRELEGKALAGDGRHLGKGWHCFVGENDGQVRGRCHRDAYECGLLLARHQEKGFATELQRCERYAQASCFQATRSAKEGPRVFCFPDAPLCADGRASVAQLDGIESTDCGVYR